MFKTAKPIFLKDLRKEMNITAFFAANFDCSGENATLTITGATYYRVTVNGEFVCYGPARAPKGFTRVDVLDISKFVSWGLNQIVVEVASYNCDTFAYVNNPGFLQAEIAADDKIVAATGYNFVGFIDAERVQKVMRYSYQRPFSEVYMRKGGSMLKVPVEVVEPKLGFMIRKVPEPDYNIVVPISSAYTGKLIPVEPNRPHERFIDDVGQRGIMGYKVDEMTYTPLLDMYGYDYEAVKETGDIQYPYTIQKGQYKVFDMGKNTAGFLRHKVQAVGDTRMILGVTERDADGKFTVKENSLTNVIDYHMIEGSYEGETFEVYGFRYIYVFVLEGEITLNELSVREYTYPLREIPKIQTDNETIKQIYKAAAETFRENTLDVFMDCPTRERAGWLMDSTFTARAEKFFTGKTIVNEAMLNNFVVATDFPNIPEGMVSSCYPAEAFAGEYIPQWSLWYGIQIYEQIQRSGQRPDKYQKSLYNVCSYFEKHENADGLVEKLGGWNFVEWSKCNQWVQDINYPTNMLYYKFLTCVSELYGDEAMKTKAEKLKEKIMERSFNGTYFMENAVYGENGAQNTENVSETCQYYAVWMGIADLKEEKFQPLKKIILKAFGPFAEEKFVPYEPSNALMGLYLRMDVLLMLEEKELLLKEIADYFGNMAEKTGTLWEHRYDSNSLNHGFASYVGEVIYKCLQ